LNGTQFKKKERMSLYAETYRSGRNICLAAKFKLHIAHRGMDNLEAVVNVI